MLTLMIVYYNKADADAGIDVGDVKSGFWTRKVDSQIGMTGRGRNCDGQATSIEQDTRKR